MRIAVYARVSRENQADRGTIAAQVDFLRRYADLNGLTIVSKYHDEAVAGPTPLVKRPEGLRMLQDARAGQFQPSSSTASTALRVHCVSCSKRRPPSMR
jgi:site-specific DNA recombinase